MCFDVWRRRADDHRTEGEVAIVRPILQDHRENKVKQLMYRHLLIATDASELANKAVDQGIVLAKALNAKVTFVFVTESWATKVPGEMAIGFPIDAYEKSCDDNASQVLTKAAAMAKAAGVDCDQRHVRDQFPADGIIEQSKTSGCDLIVMASHGRRGLSRLLLGSQANQVVTHSAVPVLICR